VAEEKDDNLPEAPPTAEEEKKLPFYVGTIVRVNYANGTGVLRTGNGRDVRFVAPFVDILDGRKLRDLTEGMQVGFDVGWTSRGLRVTKIKMF
jgi:cold shock CspA family protein